MSKETDGCWQPIQDPQAIQAEIDDPFTDQDEDLDQHVIAVPVCDWY